MTRFHRATRFLPLAVLSLALSSAFAQTPVDVHRNRYTPAQDVEVGRQAAAEAEKEVPLVRDAEVSGYVEAIGRRLVAAIPPERSVPEFRYSFTVFALPGGPIYINRGMLEAAKTKGEAAGVMAHELSHVVLRHGTAQATAAAPFQVGEIAGQILGAIIGGTAGGVIAQGSQFGLATYFLKYSRGIRARSGPLRHVRGFRLAPGAPASARPRAIRAACHGLPFWRQRTGRHGGTCDDRRTAVRAVPNCLSRPGPSQHSSQLAAKLHGRSPDIRPAGAVYEANGTSVFTHGVQVGALRTEARDLQQATQELVQLFARSNPQVRSQGSRPETISGRQGLTTRLTNVSEVTGRAEAITLSTTQLHDGSVLYVLAVAPERETATYESAFRRIRQ